MSSVLSSRQFAIYLGGVAGRRPRVPVDFAALERKAAEMLPPEALAYIAGGAGAERSMAANRAAFDRRAIVPRVLRDVAQRDTTVELFGRTLPAPVLLAPIGVLGQAHARADLAVARAAAKLDVPMIFSNQASVPMETCAAAMGARPRWFQLYWSKSDDLVASFVRRAEACGCEAIVVTLDTAHLGWRPRDLELASLPFLQGQGLAQYTSDPVFRAQIKADLAAQGRAGRLPSIGPAKESPDAPLSSGARPPLRLQTIATALAQKTAFPGGLFRNLTSGEPRAAVQRFVATYSRPSLTWDQLPFLRQHTKLPIVLKGVLHPDDARRALPSPARSVFS